MTQVTKRFLLVDDDELNNSLSKIALKKSLGEVQINVFVVPEIGLEFIESDFTGQTHDKKTTLFLDINMPTMTGWEFLDKFGQFKKSIKDQFNIYILSSSVDPSDINRAKENPLVIDFIEKPLNKATLLKMFG